jgi:putative endonuclease
VTHGRIRIGALGEDAAAAWYEARGYEIVARNWRDGRRGELDLVATNATTLVFCEVKTRSSNRYGDGFAAVTYRKQQAVRGLALAFLGTHPEARRARLRFDVASISPGGDEPRVDVIEAAF